MLYGNKMIGAEDTANRLVVELNTSSYSVKKSIQSMAPNQLKAILDSTYNIAKGRVKELRRMLAVVLDTKLSELQETLKRQLGKGEFDAELRRRLGEIKKEREHLLLLLR